MTTTLSKMRAIARGVVAFTWIWHGVVPKLIARDPIEIAPLTPLGLSLDDAWTVVTISGVAEILFGLLIIVLWRERWPMLLTIVAMTGLLLGVFFTSPDLALGAFNPVTLNVAVIALAAIALISTREEV